MMVWESCVSWSNVPVVVSTPEHTHTHTMKDNKVNPWLSQYHSQLYCVSMCVQCHDSRDSTCVRVDSEWAVCHCDRVAHLCIEANVRVFSRHLCVGRRERESGGLVQMGIGRCV